ncbi:MAG: acetoin dehydrogenase dihydrolipoyllysine-residue acetyltransferase subunit [Alphaproteobacteria bacterium]|nr:acetoin dehydrogenase dihydrolipoyllysine-residue acetyltransferase subunit [Alphaproteobacteria bacterium]
MSGLLKMPRMGETMEEGTLAAWLVEPGQPFKRGDAILEVETDKTVVEFPALGDGSLIEALVELGQMVSVGTPIARIDIGDGPDWTDDGSAHATADVGGGLTAETKDNVPARVIESSGLASPGAEGNTRRATPLARRLAAQSGIDIAELQGSGRRGRIERRDVEAAQAMGTKARGGMPSSADLQTGHGLAWFEKGPADGAPIMFIHGFAADHTAWVGLQSHMARAGCRTLAVDLPSHGATTLDAHDVDDLHPPLSQVMQHLGSQPIHLVAHSMGALAAVKLAQAHPVASLTLIAPAGVGRRINTGFLDALAAPKSVDQVRSMLKRLTTGANGLSEAAINGIFQQLKQGRAAALAQSLAGASGQAVDIRADLAALAAKVSVSLILGHRDQILDWSEALEVSPLLSVHHFPDVGHMPHWEAPTDVRMILERRITL